MDCRLDVIPWTPTTKSRRRRNFLRLPKRGNNGADCGHETGKSWNDHQNDTGAEKTKSRSARHRSRAFALRDERASGCRGFSATSCGHAPSWIDERSQHGYGLRKLSERCGKLEVLGWTREALATACRLLQERISKDATVTLLRYTGSRWMRSSKMGGIPILFQTARLHGKTSKEKVAAYQAACHGYPHVLGFELGRMFAPNGEIFDTDTVHGLDGHSRIEGDKTFIAGPNRGAWSGWQLRDARRPDFRIYTGNDLGINMIEYGSDYLLGLATFAPEKFAERDRFWKTGDPAYYALSDALQYLGNVAFREPVPAYKHSAAAFLHLTGRIPSKLTHPKSPERPVWESEILRSCAQRLGLV